MFVSRRRLLGTAAAFGAIAAAPSGRAFARQTAAPAPEPFAFDFDSLIVRAEDACRVAYRAPYTPMPEVTAAIDYARWGEIRYRTDKAPFADTGAYPVTFFHLGQYFQKSVKMHMVADGQATEFPYDQSLFEMPEDNPARKLPADSGFAGFTCVCIER